MLCGGPLAGIEAAPRGRSAGRPPTWSGNRHPRRWPASRRLG